MAGVNVKSEIKPLKKVLLHRPGKELLNLTPNTLEELLFDDIPFLKVAQEEHDAFAQALRDNGVEVVYLENLMAEVLDANPALREQFLKQFIEEAFDDIVDFAELRDFLDVPLKNYSSGMVARIAFAIATATKPDLLIVDEVLSVGDFLFQQKCEQRINSLINDDHVTVLIVSHSTEQIERLCNRCVWIEKGQLRMVGPAQEVCQAYRSLGQ